MVLLLLTICFGDDDSGIIDIIWPVLLILYWAVTWWTLLMTVVFRWYLLPTGDAPVFHVPWRWYWLTLPPQWCAWRTGHLPTTFDVIYLDLYTLTILQWPAGLLWPIPIWPNYPYRFPMQQSVTFCWAGGYSILFTSTLLFLFPYHLLGPIIHFIVPCCGSFFMYAIISVFIVITCLYWYLILLLFPNCYSFLFIWLPLYTIRIHIDLDILVLVVLGYLFCVGVVDSVLWILCNSLLPFGNCPQTFVIRTDGTNNPVTILLILFTIRDWMIYNYWWQDDWRYWCRFIMLLCALSCWYRWTHLFWWYSVIIIWPVLVGPLNYTFPDGMMTILLYAMQWLILLLMMIPEQMTWTGIVIVPPIVVLLLLLVLFIDGPLLLNCGWTILPHCEPTWPQVGGWYSTLHWWLMIGRTARGPITYDIVIDVIYYYCLSDFHYRYCCARARPRQVTLLLLTYLGYYWYSVVGPEVCISTWLCDDSIDVICWLQYAGKDIPITPHSPSVTYSPRLLPFIRYWRTVQWNVDGPCSHSTGVWLVFFYWWRWWPLRTFISRWYIDLTYLLTGS